MKKTYETPKIFRIRLNHEQAVLAVCSTTTASASGNTGTRCRRSSCRRTSSSGDSASSS